DAGDLGDEAGRERVEQAARDGGAERRHQERRLAGVAAPPGVDRLALDAIDPAHEIAVEDEGQRLDLVAGVCRARAVAVQRLHRSLPVSGSGGRASAWPASASTRTWTPIGSPPSA